MIAYFCAEYALDARLKSYAGGLGILAGDTVREMGDSGKPMIAIGLYYYKGYLAREYDWTTPEAANLHPVLMADGAPVYVEVPIGRTTVHARAWEYTYKSVRVLLLDAMLHMNHPDDQKISYYLYDQDIRIRLAQEMLLGIGGARLLKALHITPDIYHMNEGHSAFLALETGSDDRIVFTNHTVIAEGNHMYKIELIREMFSGYFAEQPDGMSLDMFLSLGRCKYPGVFSLTELATRVSQRMNGVSKLHAEKLRALYPAVNVRSITNGIHLGTWCKSSDKIRLSGALNPAGVMQLHAENKEALRLYIQHVTGVEWDQNTLIIGWARRFIQYKRPLAIFGDIVRLYTILKSAPVRVGIVISGIPHPKDAWANEALNILLSSILDKFKGQIVYIPNYSQHVAKIIVPGCDVWVNTPIVGLEACGTSGMKAALNGGLQLSTKDGWLAEVAMRPIGWELDDADISRSFYEILEHEIIPQYAAHVRGVTDDKWLARMCAAHTLIVESFSTVRMIREYESIMWSEKESGANVEDAVHPVVSAAV